MRHKCYTFIGIDAMGECISLSDNGCMLSYEERPTGGRMLKSSPTLSCEQTYTGEMMKKDWEPYQDILKEIWTKYEAIFKEDGTFDKCDDAYFEYIRNKSQRL